MVDWPNTEGKDDVVPQSCKEHLALLMKHCRVLICSCVRTKGTEHALENAMRVKLPLLITLGKNTEGKLATWHHKRVGYVVDDSWQVIKWCLEMTWPTVTPLLRKQ